MQGKMKDVAAPVVTKVEQPKQATVDLSTKSVQELKAMAYDMIGAMENVQRNLQVINAEIAKRGPQKG